VTLLLAAATTNGGSSYSANARADADAAAPTLIIEDDKTAIDAVMELELDFAIILERL